VDGITQTLPRVPGPSDEEELGTGKREAKMTVAGKERTERVLCNSMVIMTIRLLLV